MSNLLPKSWLKMALKIPKRREYNNTGFSFLSSPQLFLKFILDTISFPFYFTFIYEPETVEEIVPHKFFSLKPYKLMKIPRYNEIIQHIVEIYSFILSDFYTIITSTINSNNNTLFLGIHFCTNSTIEIPSKIP